MEYDPKDNEIVNLLKKLREANGAYPQEMMAMRRQGYLRQVAEISGAAGLAMALKNTVKSGGGTGSPPAAGMLIETLLVVAIVAEAGAVAYFYRGKLAEFFQSFSNEPRVEEVSKPPVMPSPFPEIEFTPSPVATGTETALSTPTLEFVLEPTQQGEESSQSVSTPGPSGSDGNPPGLTPQPERTEDPDNNGNQYGLTPKPDRTKKPGNEISNNNQENNPDPKKKK
jgi:hypothetical protein